MRTPQKEEVRTAICVRLKNYEQMRAEDCKRARNYVQAAEHAKTAMQIEELISHTYQSEVGFLVLPCCRESDRLDG